MLYYKVGNILLNSSWVKIFGHTPISLQSANALQSYFSRSK